MLNKVFTQRSGVHLDKILIFYDCSWAFVSEGVVYQCGPSIESQLSDTQFKLRADSWKIIRKKPLILE